MRNIRPIFKTEMLMYQSKANLVEKTLFGKVTHLYDSIIRKMPVRGLYGNRKFHVPFWSMIYAAFKFRLSILDRILISIASKSWTRMDGEIIVPHRVPYRYFPTF